MFFLCCRKMQMKTRAAELYSFLSGSVNNVSMDSFSAPADHWLESTTTQSMTMQLRRQWAQVLLMSDCAIAASPQTLTLESSISRGETMSSLTGYDYDSSAHRQQCQTRRRPLMRSATMAITFKDVLRTIPESVTAARASLDGPNLIEDGALENDDGGAGPSIHRRRVVQRATSSFYSSRENGFPPHGVEDYECMRSQSSESSTSCLLRLSPKCSGLPTTMMPGTAGECGDSVWDEPSSRSAKISPRLKNRLRVVSSDDDVKGKGHRTLSELIPKEPQVRYSDSAACCSAAARVFLMKHAGALKVSPVRFAHAHAHFQRLRCHCVFSLADGRNLLGAMTEN